MPSFAHEWVICALLALPSAAVSAGPMKFRSSLVSSSGGEPPRRSRLGVPDVLVNATRS
jgi:hypothetical protein